MILMRCALPLFTPNPKSLNWPKSPSRRLSAAARMIHWNLTASTKVLNPADGSSYPASAIFPAPVVSGSASWRCWRRWLRMSPWRQQIRPVQTRKKFAPAKNFIPSSSWPKNFNIASNATRLRFTVMLRRPRMARHARKYWAAATAARPCSHSNWNNSPLPMCLHPTEPVSTAPWSWLSMTWNGTRPIPLPVCRRLTAILSPRPTMKTKQRSPSAMAGKVPGCRPGSRTSRRNIAMALESPAMSRPNRSPF